MEGIVLDEDSVRREERERFVQRRHPFSIFFLFFCFLFLDSMACKDGVDGEAKWSAWVTLESYS